MTDVNFEEYYSRHFPLKSLGKLNQQLLQESHVLIAGVGGLGTHSAELLASLGVGELTLVDFDVIEASNLPRQVLYTVDDIGKAKVDVARERIEKRNPFIKINTSTYSIDGLSIQDLIQGVDIIVDGLDTFSTRKIVHYHALRNNIPFVFAGATGESGNLMSFDFKNNHPCMECVFGDVQDNKNFSCEVRGIHPIILNLIASAQALEVQKMLLGQDPNFCESLLLVDLEKFKFTRAKVKKNPTCPTCSKYEFNDPTSRTYDIETKLGKVHITSLCGRGAFIFKPQNKMDINLKTIVQFLEETNSTIKVRGASAVSFVKENIEVSVLNSGIVTIRKVSNLKLAEYIYEGLVDSMLSANL